MNTEVIDGVFIEIGESVTIIRLRDDKVMIIDSDGMVGISGYGSFKLMPQEKPDMPAPKDYKVRSPEERKANKDYIDALMRRLMDKSDMDNGIPEDQEWDEFGLPIIQDRDVPQMPKCKPPKPEGPPNVVIKSGIMRWLFGPMLSSERVGPNGIQPETPWPRD